MRLERLSLEINGVERFALCDPEEDTLAEVLRRMGLKGVKIGCGTGVCGACSVILNGEVIRSCTRKMKRVPEFSKITTIEGIGTPQHLHPLQQAWITYGGAQCGFCSPGFIVSAYGLLAENASPSREDVRQWFKKHHNVCRCTGYKPLVDAVMAAAEVMRGDKTMADITYDFEGET
jgi:aldehyde oxidoreductase